MENRSITVWDKIVNFIFKNAWLISIVFAVFAIFGTFLPVVTYTIKQTTGEVATSINEKMTLVEYFTTNYHLNFTMYITFALLIIGSCLVIVGKFYKRDFMTAGGIVFLLTMCMFVLAKEFFQAEENAVAELYPATEGTINTLKKVKLSWGAALGIAFSNLAFAFATLSSQKRTTRQIVEEGVMISLAFVLNFIKIPVGATGGSINFQMLPLMIIALRHGPQHGFIAGGIIYGLLTCLTDGYGFACYPFDYLIGFGSVAVMGFFRQFIFSKEQTTYNFKGLLFIFISGTLATLVRYIGSNVSSIVVYNLSLKAALAYNAFYIPLSGLVAIIALMAMYGPLLKVNASHPVAIEQDNKVEEVQ